MASDYLPAGDQDLRAWVANFGGFIFDHMAALGIAGPDVEAITGPLGTFQELLDTQTTAQAESKSTTQEKNTAKSALRGAVRALVKKLQASSVVTDAQREAMGITVDDGVRSRAVAPMTRPIVSVWVSQGLRQEIRFSDEATPTRKKKPDGVRGAEVRVKILAAGSAPPVDAGEMTFLDLATSSTYLAEFTGENAGKTAWYRLRWVNTRGEKGPWSELACGTIAG